MYVVLPLLVIIFLSFKTSIIYHYHFTNNVPRLCCDVRLHILNTFNVVCLTYLICIPKNQGTRFVTHNQEKEQNLISFPLGASLVLHLSQKGQRGVAWRQRNEIWRKRIILHVVYKAICPKHRLP